MKNFIITLFLLISSASFGQIINNNWKKDLDLALSEFKACSNPGTGGINPCSKFLGNALSTVYKIDDFYSKKLGRYMLVSEIAGFLKESGQWTLLGHGYEQKALTKAQDCANSKKAVVAVYLNTEGLGHVSYIVPGSLKPSGTWGVQVPNSAAFFMVEPEKSYIDKALSYSFERRQSREVLLYVRNY